jgi:hypothetical protein
MSMNSPSPAQSARPVVRVLRCAPGNERDLASGLLAYATVAIDCVVVDGLTIRTTSRGVRAISLPAGDRNGTRYPIVRLVDAETRAHVEREVLRQAGFAHEAAP